MERYECVVVGGGLIGATAALGLAQQGRTVALIEARQPSPFMADAPPALRVLSLNIGTVELLSRLQAWPVIAAWRRVTPFRQLAVWEYGRESFEINFASESIGQPLLGYMVEDLGLQAALWQCLSTDANVHCYVPMMLQRLQPDENGWQLQLTNGKQLAASLVIAADGHNSVTRQQVGIAVSGWQYRQRCLLISIKSQQSQQQGTWQCFYPNGPRAFLPFTAPWASLVWYDTPETIYQLTRLSLQLLSEAIQRGYPERLGGVTAVAAQACSLVSQQAQAYFLPGLALVGDAAHTIHPLAGQGVNLGFRDVSCLLKQLAPLASLGNGVGLNHALQQYQQQRFWDNRIMYWGMHMLANGFSTQQAPICYLRRFIFDCVETSPLLKKRLLKYAVGIG